jgi:heavy metal translocating P-type ATPase
MKVPDPEGGDSSPAICCDYCGLPIPGGPRGTPAEESPTYCCFGCRFAAQVTRERGEEGAARWALTRLGIAVFFTMNVIMLSMALWSGDWYATTPDSLSRTFADLLRWSSLLASLPVLILLGPGLAADAAAQIRRGQFSTDVLLVSGVVASFVLSIVSVFRGDGGIYFEVGCVVLVMVTLGRWFEATGRLKASAALEALERLLPETVRRLEESGETSIPIDRVRVGNRLRVLAGERFPTDGELAGSSALVDEQFLTGESWPVARRIGDKIAGGSLNLDASVELCVTAEPSQGTLARLTRLVREARLSRGRWQRLTDRVSSILFPIITVVAVLTTIVHAWFFGVEQGILAGLSVTLIACPCALGLATPLALWTALGSAARNQVLFRSGEVLERLADVRTICFDKTGTLTTGHPRVARFVTAIETPVLVVREEAFILAAGSTHVLSKAILDYLRDEHPVAMRRVQSIAGKGSKSVSTELGVVLLGSESFLVENGWRIPACIRLELDAAAKAGRPVCLIGWEGCARGIFSFEEDVRPEAFPAFRKLEASGCQTIVLTGDPWASAVRLSQRFGVPVQTGLLPESKLTCVKELCGEGPVAMVGDGLNDAPSLAASDVGIAMGCGADVSRDAAGVCLLGNDLLRIPWAINLARKTVRTIRWNLFWAFSWNIVGVGLAAAGLLNPALAAFAMIASSLLVISNSLRNIDEDRPKPELPRVITKSDSSSSAGFVLRNAPEDEFSMRKVRWDEALDGQLTTLSHDTREACEPLETF